MTPATETTSPDDVDRNAAKAPATSSAEVSSPQGAGSSRPGSSSTTVSVRPVSSRSAAYTLPSAP